MTPKKSGPFNDNSEPNRSGQRNVVAVLDAHCRDIKQHVEAVMPEEWHVRIYPTTRDLLECRAPETSNCLLLGEHLPEGKTGIEVMGDLKSYNRMIPTLVISESSSLRHVVATMRAGADGFLTKPLDPSELIEDLIYALSKLNGNPKSAQVDPDAQQRVSSLHSREVQVVRLISKGLMNKEIADFLGLAIITVKVYRSRAMKKLGARNAVELYQIAVAGGLDLEHPAETRSLNKE